MKQMELLKITFTIFVGLYLLSTPSASLQSQLPPTLPRKLGFNEGVRVTGYEGPQSSFSFKEQKENNSGKPCHKEQSTMKTNKGTWEEGSTDSSQLFTMDYSRARKRRPIHNKSLPVGP